MGWRDTFEPDHSLTDEEPKTKTWRDSYEDNPTMFDKASTGLKNFGNQVVDDLPGLGMMAGGTIGGVMGGPAGMLAGSGGGAALGGATKNLIHHYQGKGPQHASEFITDPMKEGANAVSMEVIGGKLVSPAAKYVGKKLLTTLGPVEDAIKSRLSGGAKATAKNYPELAESMQKDLHKIDSQVGPLTEEAKSHLGKQKKISTAILTQPIYKAIHDLTVPGIEGRAAMGKTDKAIIPVLQDLAEDFKKFGPTISESEMKTAIGKLDKNIHWWDQSGKDLNNTLKGIRNKIDYDLKVGNPTYKKAGNEAYKLAMRPISQRMRVMDEVRKKFLFQHVPNEGLAATDKTAGNIQRSIGDNKRVTQYALGRLKDLTGNDYQAMSKDYNHAKQFMASGGERSSARTNLGGLLGGVVGGYLAESPLGAGVGLAAGGMLGKLADRYGGPAAGAIIDGYLKTGHYAKFGKFGPALQEASQRGPTALAVMFNALDKNPDFRKIVGLSVQEDLKKE